MDIVIYTNPETLRHKQGTDGYTTYFWELYKAPKNFKAGDRVYFAVKGKVIGSFKCKEFNPEKDEYGDPVDHETVVWDADSWEDCEPIPCKHFQGFRYKWRKWIKKKLRRFTLGGDDW